ncbi:aspartate/glutamate racemase family protein [Tateyamaria sp. ANG-S1]|uniref:aspartate/glutamate racemase family protein n=1 Tax=Tateyamaria sp. ANG-S1 TaxID=1577905 RepID=UPI00057C63E7|nr:aspartate/glutamate racemase family protein [Tateyamaria sp. ANG-S1]KIC48440.1 aspartate racemase [Tateyamaria sp. ANG-S1]
MHIGLIGGIGPAATISYYKRLTDEMRSLGAPLELTIVNTEASTLLANNKAGNKSAQARIYADLIGQLKAAGAECAAITSLGGHFCFEETAPLSPLPLVSAVSPLDAFFVAQGLETVGLLGTGVVMRTQLYGQLEHTGAVAPQDIDGVGTAYTDMALAGTCTDAQRAFFIEEGRKLIDAGAQAVVLAGTDLNLAFDGRDVGYEVIDALDIHVDVLVALATGRATLSDHSVGGSA